MFDFAVALLCPHCGKTDVELLDILIVLEKISRSIQDHAAVLHHITDMGNTEGNADILLNQQD